MDAFVLTHPLLTPLVRFPCKIIISYGFDPSLCLPVKGVSSTLYAGVGRWDINLSNMSPLHLWLFNDMSFGFAPLCGRWASDAGTPPIRVGLLASAGFNNIAANPQCQFALAEAWLLSKLPYGACEDRGWQRSGEWVALRSKSLSWVKMLSLSLVFYFIHYLSVHLVLFF